MTNRSDNFNRANTSAGLGTPSSGGAVWITAGGELFGISSNTAYNVSNGNPGINILECDAANGTLAMSIATKASGSFCGLVLRFVDASNYIAIRAQPSSWGVTKVVAAAGTDLAPYSSAPADGDVVSVVANGSSVEVFINGVSRIGPLTITEHATATKHGILCYADTASRFDDWSWTDAGGGAPALSSPIGTGGTLTGSGSVSTTVGSGTLWWKVGASASTDPGAGNEAANGWTSQTVSATGTQTVTSFGALTAGSRIVSYLHVATGGRSAVVSSTAFTVTSGTTPVAFTGTVPAQTGTVGAASTALALAGYFSGTQTPFAYSVFSGVLPGGLSLNSSTGQITGTPTAAGSFSAVIRATDTSSNTANTGTIAWTIAAAAATAAPISCPAHASQSGFSGVVLSAAAPGTGVTVIGTFTGLSLNGSGVGSVSVAGLGQSAGAVRYVIGTQSDGSLAPGANPRCFQGPVALT